MSSKLESDVCCPLQVAPPGESYEGKTQAWQKATANYCWVYGVIHFTSPAGWLSVHRDQLRAQRSVTSMGKTLPFLTYGADSYKSNCGINCTYLDKIADLVKLTWKTT